MDLHTSLPTHHVSMCSNWSSSFVIALPVAVYVWISKKKDSNPNGRKSDDAVVEDYSIDDDHTGDYNF